MFSIGQISARTGVKVPTIRYYEGIGLMPEAGRTAGGQRRYDRAGLERLQFIRHGRDLGFSLEDIAELLRLDDPDGAHDIAARHLARTRDRIARLQRLEAELTRVAAACDGGHAHGPCRVVEAVADHDGCSGAHR